MKNILKVLAAMLVVALPFVVASCSSDDDDDKGPKQQTFAWSYENYLDPSAEDPTIYTNAAKSIDAEFSKQIQNLGYTLTGDRTFTILTDKTNADMKTEVQAAIALTKVNASTYCKQLRSGAKITVKRNNSSFVSERLN